jgi:hypothetical protein
MFRRNQLLECDEAEKVWGTILDDFEKISIKDMQYSKDDNIDAINDDKTIEENVIETVEAMEEISEQ